MVYTIKKYNEIKQKMTFFENCIKDLNNFQD